MKMKIRENLRVENRETNESKIIDGEKNILFITAFFVSKLIMFLTKR